MCIRWIDEDFKAHEDFVRPYKVESTTADIWVIVLSISIAIGHALNLAVADVMKQHKSMHDVLDVALRWKY